MEHFSKRIATMRKILLFMWSCLCLTMTAQDKLEYTDSIVFAGEDLTLLSAKFSDWDDNCSSGGYFWHYRPSWVTDPPERERKNIYCDIINKPHRNAWLISPSLDLSDYIDAEFSIYYVAAYWGGQSTDTLSTYYRPKTDTINCSNFRLLASLDYNGIDDDREAWYDEQLPGFRIPFDKSYDESAIVNAATWDTIFTLPPVPKNMTWKDLKQHVDFSKYAGHKNVHFAIKTSATIRNDKEIEMVEIVFTTFFQFIISGKRKVSDFISVAESEKPPVYSIYSTAGNFIMTTDDMDEIKRKLNHGVYIVKGEGTSRKIYVKQ